MQAHHVHVQCSMLHVPCTTQAGTYWLMRAAGGDELKLYDITEYDVAEQQVQGTSHAGTGHQAHAGGGAAEGCEEAASSAEERAAEEAEHERLEKAREEAEALQWKAQHGIVNACWVNLETSKKDVFTQLWCVTTPGLLTLYTKPLELPALMKTPLANSVVSVRAPPRRGSSHLRRAVAVQNHII